MDNPRVGDRIRKPGYKIWTVDEIVTIVPGVLDVVLTDGDSYLRVPMTQICREFEPVRTGISGENE